jgi:hypothetical protein
MEMVGDRRLLTRELVLAMIDHACELDGEIEGGGWVEANDAGVATIVDGLVADGLLERMAYDSPFVRPTERGKIAAAEGKPQ